MAVHAESIYVEIEIQGSLERVWDLTQTPDLHQKWDIRFSEIQYLPRPDAALPQRFLYATRIGLGMRIRGEGESVGTMNGPGGERTSALKFWSDDAKSLIREGSGYWKYMPIDGSVPTTRFLTRYDYDVRFGFAGRALDRAIFRPLIGWATAWSFDRLRLWIENGIGPKLSMRSWLIHFLSRLAVGGVFVYQGLVPKLLCRHPDEVAMLRSLGMSNSIAQVLCIGMGCAELALGLLAVLGWRLRWPLWLILFAMPAAALGVALSTPASLAAPFNPITLNLSVFALAAIALLTSRELPSAARCLRRPPRRDP